MINPFALSTGGVWESIAKWYQDSLICELLNHFEEKYFSIPVEEYQNFSISSALSTNIRNIILSIAIGMIIACAMIAHTRSCHGAFVRKLLRNDCTTPEKAKTLSELGFFHNISVRHELKRGVTLRKLVYCKEEQESKKKESFTDETDNSVDLSETENAEAADAEQEKPAKKKWMFWKKNEQEKEFDVDCSTMHFYIPEDLRYRADIRYEKKGSGWLPFLFTAIATVVICGVLFVYLPNILQFADNLITWLSPE